MTTDDETRKLLAQLLSELHSKQATQATTRGVSFLEGADGVFLGNIDANAYDKNSISNIYGPYGSKYSQTSIFNMYSPYGSRYGAYSINNPNSVQPVKLFVDGKHLGNISSNPRVPSYIDAADFLEAVRTDIASVSDGSFLKTGRNARRARGEAFIEAADGTFLGSLNLNQYDQDSVFNQYGPYGSSYSPISIFNQFGTYGSAFSQLSPFNQFSQNCPTIYVNGTAVGKLTKNTFVAKRVDPDDLRDWVARNVPRRLR
ncbi:hypothetical protein [Agrobacterium cavarae]|uniref:hypothetical protein n=1 Tax=Agrobacterium cavarae TaxID=2528239 RepID=UPI0028996B66|nr:hypothetical protein [Agrobacterium cavarae]